MHDEPNRCDGVPSTIRPAVPCALCRACIWRWTPASETYPRFFRPPMRKGGLAVECDYRAISADSVIGAV